jgi:hypothetical protein
MDEPRKSLDSMRSEESRKRKRCSGELKARILAVRWLGDDQAHLGGERRCRSGRLDARAVR